jgi:hypothetical protein
MAKPKDDKLDALFSKGLQNHPHGESTAPPNSRKSGKSTDPEWGKFTILLKKKTRKRASRLAEDLDPPRDLSDLAEELLSRWIQEQSR